MKSALLFIALICAVALSNSWPASLANEANAVKKERAVVKFTNPVVLMGKVLEGEYLFVHDDAAMARGEACTYVYKGSAEVSDKLVVSFHCIPTVRAKVNSFTFRSFTPSPGITELREFQFGGSSEGHGVPVKAD